MKFNWPWTKMAAPMVEPTEPAACTSADQAPTEATCEESPPQQDFRHTLSIRMRDNRVHSWDRPDCGDVSPATAWRDFYKWYFGRKGESYVMRCADEDHMFRREDILRFRASRRLEKQR